MDICLPRVCQVKTKLKSWSLNQAWESPIHLLSLDYGRKPHTLTLTHQMDPIGFKPINFLLVGISAIHCTTGPQWKPVYCRAVIQRHSTHSRIQTCKDNVEAPTVPDVHMRMNMYVCVRTVLHDRAEKLWNAGRAMKILPLKKAVSFKNYMYL